MISFVSGTVAGMGMGGGTFLIPLLILFMNTQQTQAQAQNLVVFVPMAIVVGIIYAVQKLVDWKRVFFVAGPATIVAVLGALLAVNLSGKIQRIIFGVFIVGVGVFQLVTIIVKMIGLNKEGSTVVKTPNVNVKK